MVPADINKDKQNTDLCEAAVDVRSYYSQAVYLLADLCLDNRHLSLAIFLLHFVLSMEFMCHILSINHGCPDARSVSTSQPVSVTRSVCSNCADLRPSMVTAVQLSGHVMSRHEPGNKQPTQHKH